MSPPKPSFLGPLLPNRFSPPRGRKQVYLPNFTLTLLRTPFAPPNTATFLTPLNINKLDLKDYLYNLYGIHVLTIRSYVQHAKVRIDKPGAPVPKPRRHYRPRSTKKMTIEMPPQHPFLYPAAPEDFEPWDKERKEKAQEEREGEQELMGTFAARLGVSEGERTKVRRQMEELVRGTKVWKGGVGVGVGGDGG
ncbi:MAG: hypothetical protein Q9182_000096 [Xanthomendoza sp. 2 TL-2023]